MKRVAEEKSEKIIIIVKYMYSSTAEVTECERLYLTIHFLKVSVFLCYEYKEPSVPTLAGNQPVLCHRSNDCLAFFNPRQRGGKFSDGMAAD